VKTPEPFYRHSRVWSSVYVHHILFNKKEISYGNTGILTTP